MAEAFSHDGQESAAEPSERDKRAGKSHEVSDNDDELEIPEEEEEEDEVASEPTDNVDENGYLEERKENVKAEIAAGENYDKFVGTLAAGALALSITFLKNIAPTPNKDSGYLSAAWILLVICLLASLAGRLFNQYSFRRVIRILDDREHVRYKTLKGSQVTKNPFVIYSHVCNWVALVMLVAGLVCMSIFGVANVSSTGSGESKQLDPKENNTKQTDNGSPDKGTVRTGAPTRDSVREGGAPANNPAVRKPPNKDDNGGKSGGGQQGNSGNANDKGKK